MRRVTLHMPAEPYETLHEQRLGPSGFERPEQRSSVHLPNERIGGLPSPKHER